MLRKNIFSIIGSIAISLFLISCTNTENKALSRADRIVAEMHNPNSKNVLVISHRGDWRNYPENTIGAIESIIRMGVDIMELDVKMTKDSVLVLMHDKTIDRMMNGKGLVSDFTYDSLMTFKMRRAHNVTTDTCRITTLREALICCKDRVVVNLDHAAGYYDEIIKLTEELGVTHQVLMKGKKTLDQVNKEQAQYENNMMYMPIVDIQKPKGIALFNEYMESGEVPLAYEVCYQKSTPDVKECMDKIIASGSKVWVNTLWSSLCGGYGNDDDAAFEAEDPADVYQQYIDMGVTMIQTDRPQLLINFLNSRGLHKI